MKLLCNRASGSPGDAAIEKIEIERLRANGLDIDSVDPDYSGNDSLMIGGGHLLQPLESKSCRGFRREGNHILYAVGVSKGLEGLDYLHDYRFVSVRTHGDARLLRAAGGAEPEIIPCPANLLEPEDSGIDASGMTGIQTSSQEEAGFYRELFSGGVLAFPWRSSPRGFSDANDLDCARIVARGTGGEILPAGLSPGQLIDVIRQLDLFVCGSLEGAIWAYQSGTNFLVQGYSQGVYFWAEERGLLDKVFRHPIEIPEKLRGLAPDYPHAGRDRKEAGAGLELISMIAKEVENTGTACAAKGRERAIEKSPTSVSRSRAEKPHAPGTPIGRIEKGEPPLVSIIIPVYNRLDLTCQCLMSIHENTRQAFEVIIVDNGSTDGTRNYLRDRPYMLIRNEENLGFPKAVNQGIRAARGQFMCLLNNDTLMLREWLSPLIKCLSEHPEVGLVGPKQLDLRGEIWHAGVVFYPDSDPVHRRLPLHIYTGFPHDHPLTNVERDYPALNFGCVLIRSELLEQFGLLDERFVFPGTYEDIDWCLRIRKAGYACRYLPSSRIIHAGGVTQQKTSEELKKISMEASRINADYFKEKWKDEPGDFFAPPDILELAEDYQKTSAFTLLRLSSGPGGKHIETLEPMRNEVAELVKQLDEHRQLYAVSKYAGELEEEERAKGVEIEKAKEYVEKLEGLIRNDAAELEMKQRAIEELEIRLGSSEGPLPGGEPPVGTGCSANPEPPIDAQTPIKGKISFYLRNEGLVSMLRRSLSFVNRRFRGSS